MSDELMKLHSTMDAKIWADEFCKRFTSGFSEISGQEGVVDGDEWHGQMLGWFANAIMAGVDNKPTPTIIGYEAPSAIPVTLLLSDGSRLEFDPNDFCEGGSK